MDINKKKTQTGIDIRDLKQLLKTLELGLSNDELDSIIDSFEEEFITANIIEKKVRTAVVLYERENKTRASIFT